LDAANGVGAISHGGNGLGAADPINFRGAGGPDGKQEGGINGAIFSAGRTDDDFFAPGDAGERYGHEGRRNQGRGSAGDVNTDAPEGIEFFAHFCAVGVFDLPRVLERFFGECGDVFFGFGKGAAKGIVSLEGGGQ